MATCAHAEHLDEARELLGADHVLVLGSHRVDLAELRARLVDRGWTHILSEGGPHLLRDLVAQGVADELTLHVRAAAGGRRPPADHRRARPRRTPRPALAPRGGRHAARPLAAPNVTPRGAAGGARPAQ